jgi:hypothetical protein
MVSRKPDERDAQEQANALRMEFADRVENGNFRPLFRNNLLSIFDQAVEQLKTSGLHEEVGSLRYVLARLMNEEQDLNRLTINVARIVAVSIRTVQMHYAITDQASSEIAEKLKEIMKEFGGDLKIDSIEGTQS